MPASEPKVLLRDPSGREAAGRLLGATQEGGDGRVCVILDEDQGLVLALGGTAELEVTRPDGAQTVCVRGRVLQHRVGRDAGWYVIEIEESDRSQLDVGRDRRKHPRGHPEGTAPISARISAADGSHACQAAVKDLSEGGAGLLVRPPEDLDLLAHPRLRVTLELSDGLPPAEVLGRLVFRRQNGPLLHYGLAFDALATSGFDEIRARIAAWVDSSLADPLNGVGFANRRVG